MTAIKALLFDLDGVLVDTAKFHFLAWRKMANALGFDFDESQNEALKGLSRRESMEIILRWGSKSLSEPEIQQYMQQKNEWYLAYVNDMTPEDVLPGADAFLMECKAEGYQLALGSASKNARKILDKVGLTPIFKAIIDGNIATKSKPNPQVFLKGAEALSTDPLNCLVFEDAIAGIQAAHNGNMRAVGIGQPDILSEAELVFPGLNGLHISEVIAQLNN